MIEQIKEKLRENKQKREKLRKLEQDAYLQEAELQAIERGRRKAIEKFNPSEREKGQNKLGGIMEDLDQKFKGL